MLAACVLAIGLAVVMQGFSLKQGLNALMDGFNLSMFAERGHDISGVIADVPRLLNRGACSQ